MQRLVTLAQTDGAVTPKQQEAIYALQHRLQLTYVEMMHIEERVRDSRLVEAIGQGHIPAVKPTIVLGAGESCYWEEQHVVFEKLSGKKAADRPGTLIITNKRVMFLSEQGGVEIPLKRIVRVSNVVSSVQLELSRGPGAGYYATSKPDIVAAILLTLVHHSNHQAARSEDVSGRRIPDDVKNAVWQRDGGRCVQCGATDYLEFDHIIPVSKGGANTVDNIQVLCRRCNLSKGSSIS